MTAIVLARGPLRPRVSAELTGFVYTWSAWAATSRRSSWRAVWTHLQRRVIVDDGRTIVFR